MNNEHLKRLNDTAKKLEEHSPSTPIQPSTHHQLVVSYTDGEWPPRSLVVHCQCGCGFISEKFIQPSTPEEGECEHDWDWDGNRRVHTCRACRRHEMMSLVDGRWYEYVIAEELASLQSRLADTESGIQAISDGFGMEWTTPLTKPEMADRLAHVAMAYVQRVSALEAKLADAERKAEEAERKLADASRVCREPSCWAAVIRKDDGSRICAAGHLSRWVDYADLKASEQREAGLRAKAELADEEWGGTDDEVGTWEEDPPSDPVRPMRYACRWCGKRKPEHHKGCGKAKYDEILRTALASADKQGEK